MSSRDNCFTVRNNEKGKKMFSTKSQLKFVNVNIRVQIVRKRMWIWIRKGKINKKKYI